MYIVIRTITKILFIRTEGNEKMEERIGSYPNAKKGINRIFLGELIAILGMVIIAIGSGILAVKGQTMTDLSTYTSGANIAALVILIGGLMVLVAFLFKFFGISKASIDERDFKKAMALLVIGFVASIVHSAVDGRIEVVAEIANIITNVCELLVTIFIISGIKSLAEKVNDRHVFDMCNRTYKLIIAVYVLIIALTVVALFVTNETMAVIAGLIALAIAILAIVAIIVFLSLLNNARKML